MSMSNCVTNIVRKKMRLWKGADRNHMFMTLYNCISELNFYILISLNVKTFWWNNGKEFLSKSFYINAMSESNFLQGIYKLCSGSWVSSYDSYYVSMDSNQLPYHRKIHVK